MFYKAVGLFLFVVTALNHVQAQEKVRLRYGTTISLHNLPIWVAKSTGLFDKNGLDIEVILVRGGALNLMGIVSERLQLSRLVQRQWCPRESKAQTSSSLHAPLIRILCMCLSVQR
jgi:ABC-type nitrate/sulfonate/bicarbonate transport system substrate-binding protein